MSIAESRSGGHSPLGRPRAFILWLAVVGWLLAALLGVIQLRDGKPALVNLLAPESDGQSVEYYPAAGRVIALVTGLTREQDSLLYGEFVRARRIRQCGKPIDIQGFNFHAIANGAFPPRFNWIWDVYMGYDGSSGHGTPCRVQTRLASVDSETGEIVGVDSEPGEVGIDLFREKTRPMESSESWLEQFLRGDRP